MGRYITWDAVTGRYKDAATIVGAEGIGSYYLGAAEAEVDGRLAALYSVPFAPVPEIVQDLCVDLTYYKMTLTRKDSETLKGYIDARFKDILAGTLMLTTSGTVLAAQAAGTAWGTHQTYHSVFGADDPVNWQVGSAELQASEDMRA